jgi:hypothetical protein
MRLLKLRLVVVIRYFFTARPHSVIYLWQQQTPDRGIGDVDVAKLVLPAQPLADLRDGAEIERGPLLARVLQVREEIQVLRNQGAFAHFVIQPESSC